MAPSASLQLENIISVVLKSGDAHQLEVFLERNPDKDTPIKCSQQFINKLDKLVSRSLEEKEIISASLGFVSLYKYGRNLKLPSGQGLPGLISQGLIKKMVQWFEKCRKLWIQHGQYWDETMFTLSENFLNALMAVHGSCTEGTSQVTEFFLYPVGQLTVDPRIYILIQKEAIRKYNIILDKIPVQFKKNRRILSSQEASDIMTKLASRILEGGDYDLQSSLMEALCRMATPDQRKKLADRWFSLGHVATAFAQINDSEFETACRRFLNMVNGMQGEKRRVCSYPCLKLYLGKYELLMPSDEKLEEFWIDFNLGSSSISFYFSLPDEEDGHWETVCINANEVQSYTVAELGKRKVLHIKLSEVVVVDSVEGSSLIIRFSSSLDILQAARNVFGDEKNRSTDVIKTVDKPSVEGNSSQVVPESQVSLGESEKNTASYVFSAPTAHAQTVTPAKQRISESTIFISSSEGGSVKAGRFLAVKSPASMKGSTPLAKISVCDTTVVTGTRNTTPHSTDVVDKTVKKMPVAADANVFVSGLGEEKSQETNFVPDTQPRVGCNISTNWSKMAVSEMETMPTQKITSLKRPGSYSSGLETHTCPLSGQKVSVSDSSVVLHKLFHNELTERLEKVLSDRNKDPPSQESADQRRKLSVNNRGTEETNLKNMRGPVSVTKLPRPQRSRQAKEKRKDQISTEEQTAPAKASDKFIANTTYREQKQTKVKDDSKIAVASKDKNDSEVTASMMKLISSRYEPKTQTTRKNNAERTTHNWRPPLLNRSIFNMEMMPTSKREKLAAVSLKKSLNATTNIVIDGKDTFAFNVDSPFCIGGQNQSFTKSMDTSSRGINNSSAFLIQAKKAQPMAKNKLHVKKHLFSDTDTDNALTDVSWLRESARKPKPQLIKYPKQAQIKPKKIPPQCPDRPPDLKSLSSKATKGNPQLTQKPINHSKAPIRPHAAAERHRRVAATSKKTYKEPDTDDSHSETETAQSPKHTSTDNLKNSENINEVAPTKKKRTASKQPTKTKPSMKSVLDVHPSPKGESDNKENFAEDSRIKRKNCLPDQRADKCRGTDRNSLSDPKKTGFKVKAGNSPLHQKNVFPVRERARALKDSLAVGQISFCPSPPFIEEMRTAERSAPTLGLTCSTVLTPRGSPLPASTNPPCRDTPSPILLLPKVCLTVSSKGQYKPSSFYDAEKVRGFSKSPSIPSVPSTCSLASRTPAPSPPTGHAAAEPLLTSTLLELDKPPRSPLPVETLTSGCHLDLSKVSSVSLGSLSQSSPKSVVHTSTALGISYKEKTPVPDSNQDLTHHLVSGPTRKRCTSSSSDLEEDENEEKKKKKSKTRGQRSPRMKPRKLFKSFAEVSVVDELSRISSSHWEAEEVDGDMEEDLELPDRNLNPNNLCQQLSSELNNKFQNRCKMMEIYNKQSSKAVQQHISSICVQLNKKRAQRVGQVQKVLLEQIQKMELDDNVLKSMEKDLTILGKKQIMTFHTYQKQETKRNDTLKRAFQSISSQNWDYEEGVFKSEMSFIKKDMKSIQDRLLSEMHEGEIQSVKRGLHALFFP